MAKIPKQLYVVARVSEVNPQYPSPPEPPFGFLNAYEPGKAAFEKKRQTQEQWAYLSYSGLQASARIEQQGNDYVIIGHKVEWIPGATYPNNQRTVQVCELLKFQPQIWDNNPIDGFEITKSVSRYSTSNKLWRVMDPRGVEFEITTGAFEELISNVTIIKGVIQEKCVWETNKKLIAAP